MGIYQRTHRQRVADQCLLAYLLRDLLPRIGVRNGTLEIAPETLVLRGENVDVGKERLVAAFITTLNQLAERSLGPFQLFPPHPGDGGCHFGSA